MYNISQTNIFKNWDKVCYISSKLPSTEDVYGNQISHYDKPIKYKFNYQPITDQREFATVEYYGGKSNGAVKALLDYDKFKGKINDFDLAYLYDAIPYNISLDTEYKENVNYYTKEDTEFTKLVEGTDYQIGDEITDTLYVEENKQGTNANYKVVKTITQNTKILVYFETLTKSQGGKYETSS